MKPFISVPGASKPFRVGFWGFVVFVASTVAVLVILWNIVALDRSRRQFNETLSLGLGERTLDYLLRQDDFQARKLIIVLSSGVLGIVLAGNATLFFWLIRTHRKLQREEKTKSEMISAITHNANHYLAVIKGRLDLLHMKREAGLRITDLDKELDLMSDNALSLNQLIDNLNCDELLRRGRVRVLMAQVDLGELWQRVRRNAETFSARKGMHLRSIVPPAPLPLHTDLQLLEQVLMNLLHNAVKFSPAGTEILLEAEPTTDRAVRLWVRDHGPGIPREQREHVFKPYVRLASKIRGTGLGLSNARQIMRLLGGNVSAEDNPWGSGAAFCVTVPSAEESAPKALRA